MIDLPVNPQPQVTIVVVGLRDAPMLMSCLESIAGQPTAATFEVRIVLNDPTAMRAAEISKR